MDKENEVKDLERRIWDMLDSEKQENAEKTAEHKREYDALFKANQDISHEQKDLIHFVPLVLIYKPSFQKIQILT